MKQLLLDLLPYGLAALTGFGGWVTGRRKLKADAASSELENVQQAIKIWRVTAEGLQRKCDDLSRELHSMREENKILKSDIKGLQEQLHQLLK